MKLEGFFFSVLYSVRPASKTESSLLPINLVVSFSPTHSFVNGGNLKVSLSLMTQRSPCQVTEVAWNKIELTLWVSPGRVTPGLLPLPNMLIKGFLESGLTEGMLLLLEPKVLHRPR